MAFKLDGKTLPTDVAFTSNGVNYPANWLRLTTIDEKKAIGITEVSDESPYDQRFYWSVDKAKDLAGLKTRWIEEQKQTAKTLLNTYDWYVTRKAEKATAIPTNIQNYRDSIRTTCKTREDEINACSDVAALKKLIDGTYDSEGKKTAGITDWPVDPNTIS
tara:strand:- start:145 stop:627 length:483 start_codon:yes stop_codon:yes gene_type:complete